MAKKIHVVMLPWSAFGHMIPFLELSISLAKSNVKVSYLSTPRNIQRLIPRLPKDLSPDFLNLIGYPLPSLGDDPLPPGAEATVDIPFDRVDHLKSAYDLLRHPIRKFVEDQSPDWLIVDFSADWAVEIAQECNVKLGLFSVINACTQVFYGPPEFLVRQGREKRPSPESWTVPPEWVPFESSVALKRFEAEIVHQGFYAEDGSDKTGGERLAKVINSCQVMAFRSCWEFEAEYLNLMAEICKKTVIPVGLLPPEKSSETRTTSVSYSEAAERRENWVQVFNWLDGQEPRSVVFVGFGSECKLTKDQFLEIGYGLDLSGLPFIWSVRKPSWAVDEDDYLPSGFVDRTKGRGVTTQEWAPQKEILGHPSVGGSLFHSGWGSVIETLQFGHVLVVLPFVFDQPLVARLLVEKGLALEIERGEDDGSFSRDAVAKALRTAMVEEEGQGLREKAREAEASVFGDEKLNQDYITQFVKFLKQ